jgi:hypothetical protein
VSKIRCLGPLRTGMSYCPSTGSRTNGCGVMAEWWLRVEKCSVWRQSFPIVTLSTTKHTRTTLGSNPLRCRQITRWPMKQFVSSRDYKRNTETITSLQNHFGSLIIMYWKPYLISIFHLSHFRADIWIFNKTELSARQPGCSSRNKKCPQPLQTQFL